MCRPRNFQCNATPHYANDYWTLAPSACVQPLSQLSGHAYRIHGIDAPELKQDCDGWPAGRLAATAMQELIAGKTVTCQTLDRDRYGREVARCFAGGVDLGAQMVRRGWAWAFVKFSRDYAGLEAEARRLGVHAHSCRPAWEWRAERR